MNIRYDKDKLKEKLEGKLEKKINKDNDEICKFFRKSFGSEIIEVPNEILESYLKNPVITTDEGEKKEGWEEVKSYLRTIEKETEVEVEQVDVVLHYISEEEATKHDFRAHVTTKLKFMRSSGMTDPYGDGDLYHRLDCTWGAISWNFE